MVMIQVSTHKNNYPFLIHREKNTHITYSATYLLYVV